MSTSPDRRSDADPNALSIESARQRVLDRLSPISGIERLSLTASRMRVLASDIVATTDLPPFRSAAMDGYALRQGECGSSLRVLARSLAGHPGPDELPPSCCVSITTGARVPDQADTVVQHENTVRDGDRIRLVDSLAPGDIDKGAHVRPIGSDIRAGMPLLKQGCRLRAAELGLLAAQGIDKVDVLRPLTIGLFSTGDELVTSGTALQRGQIHDSNRTLLYALLDDPTVTIADLGIVPDDRAAVSACLERGQSFDVLISSGGVSVGEADYLREMVEALGRVDLWKVAMKPGRPLAFGRLDRGPIWFGLPGNPVSAAITCLMFVRPALSHLLGQAAELPMVHSAALASPLQKRPGRVEFQRACYHVAADGSLTVDTTGLQDSHMLSSLSRANCLIRLEQDSDGAEVGEIVPIYPFTDFGNAPI